MPATRTASKPLSTTNNDSSLLESLSDPLKYDSSLVRRFNAALKPSDRDVSLKGQSKTKALDSRKLAMSAANSSSQCLGNITRSGWKASDLSTTKEVPMSNVLSIIQVFKSSIHFLRSALPKSLDNERVVSSFIGKTVVLELHQVALELLWDAKPNVVALYSDSTNSQIPKKPIGKQTKPQYHSLLQYPTPPPTDPIVVSLICTSIVQSIISLAALSISSAEPSISPNTFVTALEGSMLLPWITPCPGDQRDSLLARSHKAIAVAFNDQNTSSDVLLRLRIWSLRCLLHKPNLDPETFWLQATRYLVAFGKGLHAEKLFDKAAAGIVVFFDSVISSSQSREDKKTFMSGPAYNKFCEAVMIFVQKGSNTADARRIGDLVQGGIKTDASSSETARAGHILVFGKALNILENYSGADMEHSALESLQQCCATLLDDPAVFVDADGNPRLIPCLEKLRRCCTRYVEEKKGSQELRKAVLTFCDAFSKGVERFKQNLDANRVTELYTCAIDSLCSLSKSNFIPGQIHTYAASYEYLSRAAAFIDFSNFFGDHLDYFTKLVKCVSGTLMNAAIALYHINHYSHAIRFLTLCCSLTNSLWDLLETTDKGAFAGSGAETLIVESRTYFKSALTKRWELLGDCYSKTDDRKLAYQAFVNALKYSPLEDSSGPSRTLHPGEISPQACFKRIINLTERITHISAFDLLLKEQTSLHGTFASSEVPTETLGLLLEYQAATLERGVSKPGIKLIVDAILRDALKLYDHQYPIRRARILTLQLEFAYRAADSRFSVENVVPEILSLVSSTSLGADQGLIHFARQYEAMALMWNGLLIHQRSDLHYKNTSTIIQQATLAVSILQELFLSHTLRTATETSKPSPALAASKVPKIAVKVATRSSPRKKPTITKAPPVTPRPRRKILTTPPRPPRLSSPKAKTEGSIAFAIDPRLVSIIDTFSRMLGLLGHVPFKIRFLAILQQMATLSMESAANEFLYASADAATEYAKIGKNKHASAIFVHTLNAIDGAKHGVVSENVRILVLLGYAEVLALRGRLGKSIKLYEEARSLFRGIERNPSHPSSFEKLKGKAQILELAARGAKVYALVNVAKGNPYGALLAFRQSLKLWNRAYETLLKQPQNGQEANTKDSNPFDMGPLTAALPNLGNVIELEKETYRRNSLTEYIHWRVAEGLFCALMDLADAYSSQGSVRGSEYLVEQARGLATAINSTNYVCRSITRMVEIQLHKGTLEDALSSINAAMELIGDANNIDTANIARLSARYRQLLEQDSEATSLYSKALELMSDLNVSLSAWEHAIPSSRRSSIGLSDNGNELDIFAPDFQAAIFAQQIWLQRNEPRSVVGELIRKLDALPSSLQVEAEKAVILAKLAMHQAYAKFRTDIFISTLPESTIAIPMGLVSKDGKCPSMGTKAIMEILSTAQSYFQEALQRVRNGGKVTYAREASLSLAILRLFGASLGQFDGNDATVAVNQLHAAAALTLRREVVEAIDQKFPTILNDDLAWPSLSDNADRFTTMSAGDDEGRDAILKMYWSTLRSKYTHDHDLGTNEGCIDVLPENWTVVNISIAEDRSTVFVSRQRAKTQPLIFCVPIDRHGRKEEKEEEHFSFEEGIRQLKGILYESDQIAKAAKDVASDDRNGKVAWWAKRAALDKQLRDLLDNIEFCWLGAFKTVLHVPRQISDDELSVIADRIENVFQCALPSEKKRIAQLKLNPSFAECFATLSPQCRQEELEDIINFILDLYQFHGIHIPLSEIDVDQVAVQLRMVLEEFSARKFALIEDPHLFLILDKNVQEIPWESIPYLRGRSISRIPSLSFLLDRIEFAKVQRQLKGIPTSGATAGKALVNPKSAYFILNPSGDLEKSQTRFEPWLKGMSSDPSIGWKGIVGRKPSELEFTDALKQRDLVIYIGHGGAEQYIRSNKIKHLPRCAATMLWGCSSGLMHDMGDFDRHGTPYNYMIAGCPTLIACLWDVTDNELDRFSQSVIDKLRLNPENVRNWNDEGSVSVVTAIAESRDVCKLKYLTGAAPVVYGIPFYL